MVNKLILDIETSWTKEGAKCNPSPYLPTNKLVSVGYHLFSENETYSDYLIFNHNEFDTESQAVNFKKLQDILDKADLVIGHNLKFDMSWLYECGFKYDKALYDTMIAEYVFAKGLKIPLSLDESCKRYKLDVKSDILGNYREKGVNTHEVPLLELVSYGTNDINITKQLYDKQQELIASSPDHQYMSSAVALMNETLPALIAMERNGIFIDLEELNRVEIEYRKEYAELKTKLEAIVLEVMGHTPINLDSPEHLSWVLYSCKVKDKAEWKEIFNLGSEVRNSVTKTKYPRRYDYKTFEKIVLTNTETLYKTEAKQCEVCSGAGRIRKTKKDGTAFKKETICSSCKGRGFHYNNLKSYAGLRLTPLGSYYTAVGGFSTDKTTIGELLQQPGIADQAKEFLTALLRLNSVDTYLNTFVEGIRKNVRNNILHTNFNMCVTATGRLSSSNPNFQNLPRAKTFPIRRVIKSRWEGGKILSVDFKQLEFRVAAMLANDEQAKKDILNDVDIHAFTRDTITAAGQSMDRQDAKIRTFKPLFGGIKGTPAEEAYYRAFLQKYSGIDKWQKALENEALLTKKIKSPSGRIYAFPLVKRLVNGSVAGHTQIKNYIVQGFATGDITPVALIKIYNTMLLEKVKSKLILTVHDDITIDVHPEEENIMINILVSVFNNMNYYITQYFGIKTEIPISGEFSIGANWLDKKEIA